MKTVETKVIDIKLDGDFNNIRPILVKTVENANNGDEIRIDGKYEGFVFGGMVISKFEDVNEHPQERAGVIVKDYRNTPEVITKKYNPILYETFTDHIEKYTQAIKNPDEGGAQ